MIDDGNNYCTQHLMHPLHVISYHEFSCATICRRTKFILYSPTNAFKDKIITLKTTGAVYSQLLTCELPQIQRSDTLPHLGVWQVKMKELKIMS